MDVSRIIDTLRAEAEAADAQNMARIEAGFSEDYADGANRGMAAGLRRAAAILTTEAITADRAAQSESRPRNPPKPPGTMTYG